jgi:hemolysin III
MSERHGSPDVAGVCGRCDRSRDWPASRAAGWLALVVAAAIDGKASKLTAIIVYTGRSIAMLGCSAAYSLLQSSRRRDFLRRLDQSAIFLMIAGT